MIEVHAVPTADTYPATLKRFVSGKVQGEEPIDTVVLYEKEGILETGVLGVKKILQISTSCLAVKPSLGDRLIIGSQYYKIVTVQYKNPKPAFYPYWKLEIKEIQNI